MTSQKKHQIHVNPNLPINHIQTPVDDGQTRKRQARHILRAPLSSAVQEALGPMAQLAKLELNGAR